VKELRRLGEAPRTASPASIRAMLDLFDIAEEPSTEVL